MTSLKCLNPGQSIPGGQACISDDECLFLQCEDNVCTHGNPGDECNDDSNCIDGVCDTDSSVWEFLSSGLNTNKCLYPERSRHHGQQCTLDAECGIQAQTNVGALNPFNDESHCAAGCCGNSGGNGDWGSGYCKGGMKSIDVNGAGTTLYAIDGTGEVLFKDNIQTANQPWQPLDARTFTMGGPKHYRPTANEIEMDQIIASNSLTSGNQELWGVDLNHRIHYRSNRHTPWVLEEQIPSCTCEGGQAQTGSNCRPLDEWSDQPNIVTGESCAFGTCRRAYTWERSSTISTLANGMNREKGKCVINSGMLPTVSNFGSSWYKIIAAWKVGMNPWMDRGGSLENLDQMVMSGTSPATDNTIDFDFMIMTKVGKRRESLTLTFHSRTEIVVLRTAPAATAATSTTTAWTDDSPIWYNNGWSDCSFNIVTKTDGGTSTEAMSLCKKQTVNAGITLTIPGSALKRMIFVKVLVPVCPPFQVPHSNKAASGSIIGDAGTSVVVTCDNGHVSSGHLSSDTMVCSSAGEWSYLSGFSPANDGFHSQLCSQCATTHSIDTRTTAASARGDCVSPALLVCEPSGGWTNTNYAASGSLLGVVGTTTGTATVFCDDAYTSVNGQNSFTSTCSRNSYVGTLGSPGTRDYRPGVILCPAGGCLNVFSQPPVGFCTLIRPLHTRSLVLRPHVTQFTAGHGVYGPAEISRTAHGFCQLDGLVNFHAGQRHLTTVPLNCRPNKNLYFVVNRGNSFALISTASNGRVRCLNGCSTGWISLSGIAYQAGNSNQVNLPLTSAASRGTDNSFNGVATVAVNADGMCSVTGAVRLASNYHHTASIATLPVNCRPRKRLVFTLSRNYAYTRVDVMQNGNIHVYNSHSQGRDLSLSGINFKTNQDAATVTNIPLVSGATNFGGAYGPPTFSVSAGLCVLSGLTRTGTTIGRIASLPASCQPKKRLVFTLGRTDNPARIDVLTNGDVHWLSGGSGTWVSFTGISFVARAAAPEVVQSQGGAGIDFYPTWTLTTRVWTDRVYTFNNLGSFTSANYDYLIRSTVSYRHKKYRLSFSSAAKIVVFQERDWNWVPTGWSRCDDVTGASPATSAVQTSWASCWMQTVGIGDVVDFSDGSDGVLTVKPEKTMAFVKYL